MKPIGVMWHEKYVEVFSNPAVLPLWSRRMREFRELIELSKLLDYCVDLEKPESCSLEDLLLLHEESYILRIVEASKSKNITLLDYGDTYVYPGMIDDILLLVGGSLKMYEKVVSGVWKIGYQPYGGLHHARRDRASGFCPVNDIGIVVEHAKRNGIRRILIVDIDVHHADGVQEIYWEDPEVVLVSFHAYNPLCFYPGTGSEEEVGGGRGYGTKLNIPLDPGTGDEAFLRVFNYLVPEVTSIFNPDLIIAQLGVDGHHLDSLGILNLTTNAYLESAKTLALIANNNSLPLLAFGGGGYGSWSSKCMLAEILGFSKALNCLTEDVNSIAYNLIEEEATRDPSYKVEKLMSKAVKLVELLARNV